MGRGTDDEVWRINFVSKETWKRAVFMLFFLAVISMTEFVIYSLVILQFITVLLSGKPNEWLTEFGGELSVFVYNIFSYLTYNSEQRPFPFSAWPGDVPRRATKKKRSKAKAAK